MGQHLGIVVALGLTTAADDRLFREQVAPILETRCVHCHGMRHLTDALIVGEPFGHAALPNRQDVTIISTNRTTGTRDNVFVIPDLEPIGPLSQP